MIPSVGMYTTSVCWRQVKNWTQSVSKIWNILKFTGLFGDYHEKCSEISTDMPSIGLVSFETSFISRHVVLNPPPENSGMWWLPDTIVGVDSSPCPWHCYFLIQGKTLCTSWPLHMTLRCSLSRGLWKSKLVRSVTCV